MEVGVDEDVYEDVEFAEAIVLLAKRAVGRSEVDEDNTL